MKDLSEVEKKFLIRLIQLSKYTQNVFLGNILDDYLENIDVFLDHKNERVEYRFDEDKFSKDIYDLTSTARTISWNISIIIKLLKYLESQDLVLLYQESIIRENHTRFGRLTANSNYIRYRENDEEITDLLLKNAHKVIIVGQTIKEYVENEFKTKSDLQHIESVKIAKEDLKIARKALDKATKSVKQSSIAIIISIILGILSVWVSFIFNEQQLENETKINQTQYDDFMESIRLTNDKLKSIDKSINEIEIPDTIITKTIEK